MKSLSDRELEALYLSACARNIQWLLDSYRVEDNSLSIEGWAIDHSGQPERAQFLIDGIPFEDARYPICSPDVGEFFWNVPAAQTSRFVCKTTLDWQRVFRAGFARLEFRTSGADPGEVRARAWYLPNPQNDLPVPSEAQVRRVISVPDRANYLIGGAAVYKRLEYYLQQK